MPSIEELYQGVIVEHDRSPRNFRRLDAPTHHAEGRNPLCGDEVALDLRVDDTGHIAEVGFIGKGCAVSKASASLMTTAIKDKTPAEARELFEGFHALMTGGPVDPKTLGKLAVFQGLSAYPMRVKCAMMAWHTLKEALDDREARSEKR
jgi:nitrogen fixation NifU-like protein